MEAHKKALKQLKSNKEKEIPPKAPRLYLDPEDYLFMPQYENRSTAMEDRYISFNF